MSDVFISYSRRDTEFVRRLHTALMERGRDAWIDWEDIPATADWWKEISAAIEATDTFIFIISPDSVRSEVCRKEIEHAIGNNKRFVPLLHKPVDEPTVQQGMHPSISTHNWIFFRETDDFNRALDALVTALDTDLSHVRQHTRLLVRSREWEGNGQNSSFLLQGDDLTAAEDWLALGVGKKPNPLPLHVEYISASREAATRRQRRLLAGVSAALVVAVSLALLSFLLYGEANVQRGIAEEKSITATVAQGLAQIEANKAETQAAIALDNAATAIIAQGEAQAQADIAGTQAVRAENNAATAAYAQGEAQIQADIAGTQAAIALNNAAIATVAQGEAQIQADIAGTQAVRAENNAATATNAQGQAEQQATAVSDERNRAQSIALAGQAQLEIENGQRERGVLIALHALENYPYTWQAERALGFAVQNQLARVRLSGGAAYTSVDFSPDGLRLVTGNNDGVVRIWDVAAGREALVLAGHTSGVIRALWSPDGARIVTASSDETARIWDAETGETLSVLSGHTDNILGVAWSPDGTRVATASQDGTARIWNASNGEVLFTLSGHSRAINSVDWSPDGTQVVTGGADNLVIIWDVETGLELFTLSGHSAAINRALWSPDGGKIITISGDATAKIWDSESGAELSTLVGHLRNISRAAWSPDGSRVATVSGDDTAKIWDAATGVLRATLFGHTNDLSGAVWSPDGRELVTISDDGTARVWDADSGAQILVFSGHTDLVFSVAWSPDGSYIATASADQSARLWQVWNSPSDLVEIAQSCCATRKLTDEESQQFGIPPMDSDNPPEMLVSCPDALPSRLYPGVRGQVSSEDNRALNVRNNPRLSAAQIAQISPQKTFWVMGDPVCADGFAWFPVIFGINAAPGWIAEGGDGIYFVEPRP